MKLTAETLEKWWMQFALAARSANGSSPAPEEAARWADEMVREMLKRLPEPPEIQ